MVDRVRHGNSIDEARRGLEHIDAELSNYPAFRDAGGGLPEPKGLLAAPEEELLLGAESESVGESLFGGFAAPPSPTPPVPAVADVESIFPWENKIPTESFPSNEPPPSPQEDARSAYERAWGKDEAPSWYEEKPAGSRIDSALGEAAVGMDMFSEGGMFDAEPAASYSLPTTPPPSGFATPAASYAPSETYINAAGPPAFEREPTSSQLIRRAQDRFGAPGPYSEPGLPAPTEAAIREECRPGVVKQARAKQALLTSGKMPQPTLDSSNLKEFPGLSRIVNSMGSGRVKTSSRKVPHRKTSWIGALLGPAARAAGRTTDSYASEYGDGDGGEVQSGARFQSSQHIRLRSDQDHQADVGVRARESQAPHPHSAQDALDHLVNRVSSGEDQGPTQLPDQEDGLRFSQLRRTSSKGDPHPLPGIKRLE
jgi:hypothetical protein